MVLSALEARAAMRGNLAKSLPKAESVPDYQDSG